MLQRLIALALACTVIFQTVHDGLHIFESEALTHDCSDHEAAAFESSHHHHDVEHDPCLVCQTSSAKDFGRITVSEGRIEPLAGSFIHLLPSQLIGSNFKFVYRLRGPPSGPLFLS